MDKRTGATGLDEFFNVSNRSSGSSSLYHMSSANPESSTRLVSHWKRNDIRGTAVDRPASSLTGEESATALNASTDNDHAGSDVADPRTDMRKLIDYATELQNINIVSCLTEYKVMMEGTNPTKLTQEEIYARSKTFNIPCADASSRDFTATVERLRRERDSYKEECEKLRRELGNERQKDERHDAQKLQEAREKLEQENQKLSQELHEERKKRTQMVKEWKIVLEEKKEKELETEQNYKDQIEKLKENLKSNRETLKQREKEKAEALNRLSKEMGNKLNNKNPNIADLSDSNRPTKIAEKYNELYDNEWTDALETLTKDITEEIAIRRLLEILLTCNQFCQLTSSEQMKNMYKQLMEPSSSNVSYGVSKQEVIPPEIEQLLNECRKTKGIISADYLYKEYLKQSKSSQFARKVPEYVKKCLEVCWAMVMHDPWVALGEACKAGDKFDGSIYKHYTKTGNVVSYTVWVPLLLHANGPLLSKGVAQPVPTNVETRAKSAPAWSTRRPAVDTTSKTVEKYTNNFSNTYQRDSPVDKQYQPHQDHSKQTMDNSTYARSHNIAWKEHTTDQNPERWDTSGLTTAQHSQEPDPQRLRKAGYDVATKYHGDTYKPESSEVTPKTLTQNIYPRLQNTSYSSWSQPVKVYLNGKAYVCFKGQYYREEEWQRFLEKFIKDTPTGTSYA